MKRSGRENLSKIAILGFLLAMCLLATYYSNFVLKSEIVFTHLFYVPIIIAGWWWSRKGIAVAVFLALMLLISHIVSRLEIFFRADILRASMFVVVGTVVAILSEKRKILEDKLRKHSKTLEQRVEERTSEFRESEEKRRAILNSISDAIIVLDPDLNVIWANKIATGRCGAVPGKKCYQAYKWLKEPCADCVARKTFTDAVARTSEEEGILKDGDHINFIVSCSPVKDPDGKVISIVEVLHDITEHRKTEEELEKHREYLEKLVKERTSKLEKSHQALSNLVEDLNNATAELEKANIRLQETDRLKSVFLASMSHELRTPLNSIIGFTGIILQGMTGEITGEQKKQLTMVKNSANDLLNLINDLLDISKIEAGKIELLIEEFDLSALVREVKDSFGVAVEEKDLKMSLKMPKRLIIRSDERRTKQILMNLVSNAVKFTDQGKIEIKVAKKDKEVEVSVRDTGIGIRKDEMDRLFKSFTQISIQGRPKQEGTGLGLYLCKKIVDLLGAEIKGESEFSQESVFTFTLPLKYQGTKK